MKRIFKYTVLLFLSAFVAFNLLLAYWSISSIVLTLVIYGLLLAGIWLVSSKVAQSEKTKNLTLFFTTLILCLFTGELLLKYVFKIGLQRQELDGEFFYSLPYSDHHIDLLARKYVLKLDDADLRNNTPHLRSTRKTAEFEYAHHYNSLGLRGKEPDSSKNRINIIALGDSYTEGSGTPADSTWPQLLQDALNKKYCSTDKKVQSINGGLSGLDPFAGYHILEKLLIRYNPRMVIVAINSTDITDVIRHGGWQRYSHPKTAPWWARFYQFSYIARAVIHAVRPVNWLLLTETEYKHEEKAAIDSLYNCLTGKYAELAAKEGFQLVVVLHPMLPELEQNDFPLRLLSTKLRQHSEVKTVNLFEEFQKTKEQQNMVYPSLYWQLDGHHNSKGYNLWADILASKLSDEVHCN